MAAVERISPDGRLLSQALDRSNEGILIVAPNGRITFCNERARELLGLIPSAGPGHDAGKLLPGDIVLLANSSLGSDDGGMEPSHLALIGISPSAAKPGDAVVAIGIVGSEIGSGSCIARSRPSSEPIQVHRLWPGGDGKTHRLTARLSEADKLASIIVDDVKVDFKYRISVGHGAIVDPHTFNFKFYETPGYTARGETMKDIISGKAYAAKLDGRSLFQVEGSSIFSLCPGELAGEATGNIRRLGPKDGLVNGIPLRYRVEPLKLPGERDQAACIYLTPSHDLSAKLTRSFVMSSNPAFSRIAGSSLALCECVRLAERAAASSCPILLAGESGTGKSLLARAIHAASPRRGGPLVVVNCAAIPNTLLESELFGYGPGAFTGALRSGKKGRFAEADGGTLLLDEVSELDLSSQAKLLHVIEDGIIQPLGASSARYVDVRIIAATNQDLRRMVDEKKFRADLYYRLNVFPINLPPLRERPDDIPDIVIAFLKKLQAEYGREITVSNACMNALVSYHWPGNVRELENVLERAALLSEDGLVDLSDLPAHIRGSDSMREFGSSRPLSLDEARRAAEKSAILDAIRYCQGNHTRAMKLLGIGRTTFYQKLKELRISLEPEIDTENSSES